MQIASDLNSCAVVNPRFDRVFLMGEPEISEKLQSV